MMEVHKPTKTRNMAFMGTCANPKDKAPAEFFNTGSEISVVVGETIANTTKNNATAEPKVSMILLDTLLPMDAPTKRPISIRNQ